MEYIFIIYIFICSNDKLFCEITYGLINTISSDTTDKHNTNFIDGTLTRSSSSCCCKWNRCLQRWKYITDALHYKSGISLNLVNNNAVNIYYGYLAVNPQGFFIMFASSQPLPSYYFHLTSLESVTYTSRSAFSDSVLVTRWLYCLE